jgi:hypothetical protein
MGATTFCNIDLQDVDGLEQVEHFGPSTIGIDTIYKSQGRIPAMFLRGCGVPDDFIAFAQKLGESPIQFYSCFISYSTNDQGFADQLYADLQGRGVRCWFAPHELAIGDRFTERIEESIRKHEKLLLIISENSIAIAVGSSGKCTLLENERNATVGTSCSRYESTTL